ncbi:MAG: tetratricopeptide repeat protein [Chloroflexota bacterium]|nr:tetratricopeptide repeat protein [Chloroflexota bacterium]
MAHYRKINRNRKRPFFSQRRRGLSGVPLALFAGTILGICITLLALTFFYYDEMQGAALSLLGWVPTPTLFPSQHAEQGLVLYNQGDIERALADFEQAIQQRPNDVAYLYEYGRVLIEADQYELARELGERAIVADPDDPRGYALKARSLIWSDPGSAIPVAVSGLERDADFAPLHAALAVAYTNIGRYAEGYQRGLRATQLDPLDPFAHRAFSIPLIYTGRSSEAIAALEQAVAINPNHTAAYFELAGQYRRQNYQEMAVGIYRRILELEPGNAKAYLRICQTYAEVGEFLEGSRYCETATEIDETYAPAWQYLGQLQYNRRNYESALDSLERCVALGSVAVECYYIRGLAYYFLDQCDTAWRVLQEALQLTSQPSIIAIINEGLSGIRANCPGYENVRLPTPIPPTPVPPTPIGGI